MLIVFLLLSALVTTSSALIVGSKSTASSQAFTVFPSADSNNTLLGFASFEKGFSLFDQATTATFDNYLPVLGPVSLNNGKLVLRQDFILANQSNFVSGGVIEGNNHAVILPAQPATFSLPLTQCSNFAPLASANLEALSLADTISLDWSFDDAYIASGQRTLVGTEFKLFYFNGTTLTTTKSVEFGTDVNSVRWHPTQRYVAIGLGAISGDDVKIYKHTPSNGTFVETGGALVSGSTFATAWHPSGNYLVLGNDNNTQELMIFPITNGVMGSPSLVNLASDQDVNRDALAFSPGGDKIVVGLTSNATANISEIMIYNFAATSLTLSTSLDAGVNVQCVDWSPTGSYIAAALTGSSSNIRVYDASSGILRELLSSRQVESRDAYAVHWHPSGNYLLAAVDTGLSSEMFIYFFDKINKQLIYLAGVDSRDEIFAARWSHSGNYITHGFQTLVSQHRVDVASFLNTDCKLFLDNTTMVCNSDLDIQGDIHFKGTCRIDGQGHLLMLVDGAEFIVRPNSSLTIENCSLCNVRDSNIRCLRNNASIILRNCSLLLDRSFTFSQGALYFQDEVILSGTQTFNYTTPLSSTIADNSVLFIDYGATFKYNPSRAKKDLLSFESTDAQLYLNGCTLYSTRTGLQLSNGIMIIDNNVTLSSDAVYFAESLNLKDSLDVQVRGGATLDLYGYITYE